jgi:hypothetical protein
LFLEQVEQRPRRLGESEGLGHQWHGRSASRRHFRARWAGLQIGSHRLRWLFQCGFR